MDKTIVIGLSGHDEQYRLDEDAYQRLTRYLDRAGARLHDDPDRAEILADWVRTLFLVATVVTAGIFALVYVALAFLLPIASGPGARQ